MAKGFRFAVGRNDDIRSSIWRIWSKKDDLYLAARAMAGVSKISFHASGVYRHAVVSKVPRAPIYKWKRPKESSPGVTPVFTIIVPVLTHKDRIAEEQPVGKVVSLIHPPAKNSKLIIRIFIANKVVKKADFIHLARGKRLTFVGTVELRTERAWVLSNRETYSPDEQKFIQNLVAKIKIHLKPGGQVEDICMANLHVVKSDQNPPTIVDVQLGISNINVPLEEGSSVETNGEKYSQKEAQRRFEQALRGAQLAEPAPMKEIPPKRLKKKSKPKKKPAKETG